MNTRQVFGSMPMVLVIVAGVAVANPAAAYTAGDPIVESTLGERLRGYLRLELQPGESPPESVSLASDDTYSKLGIAIPEFGASLYQLRLQQRSELSWDIVIESQTGVREPIVPLVLEIKQGRFTQYREIALMIDPPGMPNHVASQQPISASAPGSTGSTAFENAETATIAEASRTPPAHRHTGHGRSLSATASTNGPKAANLKSRSAATQASAPKIVRSRTAQVSAPINVGHFRLETSLSSWNAGTTPDLPIAAAAPSTTSSTVAAPIPEVAPTNTNVAAHSVAPPTNSVSAPEPAQTTAVAAPAAIVGPVSAGAAESKAKPDDNWLVRLLAAAMLLIAGLLVWSSRRTSLIPSPTSAKPTSMDAVSPSNTEVPPRGPGRVTPIENAYAIRGSTPPPQRVVGE